MIKIQGQNQHHHHQRQKNLIYFLFMCVVKVYTLNSRKKNVGTQKNTHTHIMCTRKPRRAKKDLKQQQTNRH